MYTVTFYSFKGGVGRTLALANVGASLALAGKRVLLVDFDLEAPGLQTFDSLRVPSDRPGIVDYVTQYIATLRSPNALDFLQRVKPLPGARGELWVMPSGRQDAEYGERFGSIDWQSLYANKSGYLMFEDLKEQWRQYGFDYVLIDSRTGHTDVGGICTRQLADAVVLLFMPNRQNIRGLRKVVDDIRWEATGPRRKQITLHFVASNVPEIDDEEAILSRQIDEAAKSLDFVSPTAVIHHYASLALLDQSIFTLVRPQSRLAHEYAELRSAIVRANSEDREGVLDYLRGIAGLPGATRQLNVVLAKTDERITAIAKRHPADPEVLLQLGLYYEAREDWRGAISWLTKVIDTGWPRPDALLARARLYRTTGDSEAAVADALAVLTVSNLALEDLMTAVALIRGLRPEALASLAHTAGYRSLTFPAKRHLLDAMLKQDTLAAVGPLLDELLAIHQEVTGMNAVEQTSIVLAQVALGRFRDAMQLIAPAGGSASALDVGPAFNYGMAAWGETGAPLDVYFRLVLERDAQRVRSEDPNYEQCLALAAWIVDRAGEDWKRRLTNAKTLIDLRPTSCFSAWRYLYVDRDAFIEDLTMMRRMFEGEALVPEFIVRSRRTLAPLAASSSELGDVGRAN